MNAKIFTNACGPCIGQWAREGADKEEKNSIIHSFNRNFSKRADGNPNTHAFVASPEMVAAVAISGRLDFDPVNDTLINQDGEEVKLDPPTGMELPPLGFDVKENGYLAPQEDGSTVNVVVNETSERLQLLTPFTPWDSQNLMGAKLLIKALGKCTTDHISMAGPWLRFRGHLDNISNNCLIGAVNAFNEKTNFVKNQLTGEYGGVPDVQRQYKAAGSRNRCSWRSQLWRRFFSRTRRYGASFLGVKVVLVKSFARIHETNLKKQGMLGITFNTESDYNLIQEDDTFNFIDLKDFAPGKQITVEVVHADGSKDHYLSEPHI